VFPSPHGLACPASRTRRPEHSPWRNPWSPACWGVLVVDEVRSVGALLGVGQMLGGLGIASVGREAPPNHGRRETVQAAGLALGSE